MENGLWILAGIIVGGFLNWIFTRKKTTAEVEKTETETKGIHIENTVEVTDLANKLFNEVLDLKEKVAELIEELAVEKIARIDCQARLAKLEEQLNKK